MFVNQMSIISVVGATASECTMRKLMRDRACEVMSGESCASEQRLQEVRRKLEEGFYDTPEVLEFVARAILADLRLSHDV